MAIVQTGSISSFSIVNNANTGTVSSAITVPDDAELVVVGVSGYQGTANGFAAMTFTKGGADTAMVKATGGDSTNSFWQGAMFYQALPDTGTNKSLKWDWIGTGVSSDPDMLISVSFWKGIDTASPVRDSDGSAPGGSMPHTTPTLTCVSGDKIVAFCSGYITGGGSAQGTIDSWSNLTLLENILHDTTGTHEADGAWATGDPTADTTVAASTSTNMAEGAIVALVVKAAAAAAATPAKPLIRPLFWPWRRRLFGRRRKIDPAPVPVIPPPRPEPGRQPKQVIIWPLLDKLNPTLAAQQRPKSAANQGLNRLPAMPWDDADGPLPNTAQGQVQGTPKLWENVPLHFGLAKTGKQPIELKRFRTNPRALPISEQTREPAVIHPLIIGQVIPPPRPPSDSRLRRLIWPLFKTKLFRVHPQARVTVPFVVVAEGVTFTINESLIAGTASGEVNASASGVTLTVSESLLAGSASGQSNATAAGVTVSDTLSLLAGAASGEQNATASGVTFTITGSLVAGSASGEVDATASGAVLTETASFLAGAATGEQQQQQTAPDGGGWITFTRQARLAPVAFKLRALPLRGKLFTRPVKRGIGLPEPVAGPAVASIAMQPVPEFRLLCRPVFDKSAVIEKRKAQVPAILEAARQADMRLITDALEWL